MSSAVRQSVFKRGPFPRKRTCKAKNMHGRTAMSVSDLAGKPAPKSLLIDVGKLQDQYYSIRPDPDNPLQRVAFGTSGHRGSAAKGSFNEAHILAITQAI